MCLCIDIYIHQYMYIHINTTWCSSSYVFFHFEIFKIIHVLGLRDFETSLEYDIAGGIGCTYPMIFIHRLFAKCDVHRLWVVYIPWNTYRSLLLKVVFIHILHTSWSVKDRPIAKSDVHRLHVLYIPRCTSKRSFLKVTFIDSVCYNPHENTKMG